MAIRIEHGEPSTYAELGRLVGEGQREEREIARAEQRISEARQLKFRQESQQLQADLAEQNAQRQIAFQFERLSRVQEHDLEMFLQRNQILQMNQLQKEIKAENERDTKLRVIDETDTLSTEQKATARLQVLTGVRLPAKQETLYDKYLRGELGNIVSNGVAEGTVTEPLKEPFKEPFKYKAPEGPTLTDLYASERGIKREKPVQTKSTPEIPEPKTEAEIAKLPKGTVFRAPDGTLKYR